MLDAPGWLWLIIFLVTYEVGKTLATRWFDRRSNTTKRPDAE